MLTGLQEKTVLPFFQPIVCVDSREVFAYEVLGRVLSPKGIYSLGPFFHDSRIPAEEKLRIDRSIRFNTLEKMKKMQRNETLFLNIQPEWLLPFINRTRTFPTLEHLQQLDISGNQIVIEICEDEFCEDMETLFSLVNRYREIGCKIAVDDFGEKFSNLERIMLLRPDFLKIGTGLLEPGGNRETGSKVLGALGAMCERTGTSLVLEEVESMEQFLMGLNAGVRYFQGFFFARPMADFVDKNCFHEVMKKGLDIYLLEKGKVQERQLQLAEEMNAYVRSSIRDDVTKSVKHPEHIISRLLVSAPSDCLRAYICDARGYQVTPNYTRTFEGKDKWKVQPEYRGRNWCWRPYFLPKVMEAGQTKEGTFSQPYQDLKYRKKVWTFVFPLETDLFLFIDCNYGKENSAFTR